MITCIAIDDDPIFLKLLEAYFMEITSAKLLSTYQNPTKGIVEVVKQKPDVLLIDREMPYLDGFETLSTLEEVPKVIMISAHLKMPDTPLDIEVHKYIDKTKLSSAQLLEESLQEVIKQ